MDDAKWGPPILSQAIAGTGGFHGFAHGSLRRYGSKSGVECNGLACFRRQGFRDLSVTDAAWAANSGTNDNFGETALAPDKIRHFKAPPRAQAADITGGPD
jgi:hypothetical protein